VAPVRRRVRALGERLLAALGPQGWWPAETPDEVVLGAVLTQAVAWANAARAVAQLKAAGFGTLAAVAAAEPQALEPLVRPAGYYRAKARKLVAVARFVTGAGGLGALAARPAAEVRAELLGVYGIGPETADAILCYALGQPVFVCDAYARRVLGRLGLLPEAARASYEAAAAWAREHVVGDAVWLGELHALLVALAKAACRKAVPRCGLCPLRDGCAFARAAAPAHLGARGREA
jgi:endonuclease-3 related protein